jgi:formylglycine-generating enzyme required for sulfatase activity
LSAAPLLAAVALFVCENPREFENPIDKEGSNYLYGRPYSIDDEWYCTGVNDDGVALLFTDSSRCTDNPNIPNNPSCDPVIPTIKLEGPPSVTIATDQIAEFRKWMHFDVESWDSLITYGKGTGGTVEPVPREPCLDTVGGNGNCISFSEQYKNNMPGYGSYIIRYMVEKSPCNGTTPYAVTQRTLNVSQYVAQDTGTPMIALTNGEGLGIIISEGTYGTYWESGWTVTVNGISTPDALDSVVIEGTNSGNSYRQKVEKPAVGTIAFTSVVFTANAAGTYAITYYASYKGTSMSVAKTATATRNVTVLEADPVTPPTGEIFTETVGIYTFDMVKVAGGTFTMGCTEVPTTDCYDDETKHTVTLSRDYYVGKIEVTQGLWKAVMGSNSNPSYFTSSDNLPVESVSWYQVNVFIDSLNRKTGRKYRLPTEAEWEFAARGGNKSRGYKYSGSSTIGEVAWYSVNSDSKTHPVGGKNANELGIHDMCGNVWEWVGDWYGDYNSDAQTDPTGPSWGSYRVFRGCGWSGGAEGCSVSFRFNGETVPGLSSHNLGFRLVLPSP